MRNRLLDGPALLEWIKSQCSITSRGCWEWNRSRFRLGYAVICYKGKNRSGHRVACHLAGKLDLNDPRDGLHSCDNPPCCNPEHIDPGTHKANMGQMVERGRHARLSGPRSPRAKLTAEDVVAIRADTRYNKVIAFERGLCEETIARVKRKETYK